VLLSRLPRRRMTVNYSEVFLSAIDGMTPRNQEPLFPFGYGLSYTTFRYSELKIERGGDEQATVKVRVTNTGAREGAEGCSAVSRQSGQLRKKLQNS